MRFQFWAFALGYLLVWNTWSTVLGDAAAKMKAGQWSALQSDGIFGKDFLETRGQNAYNFSILQYADKAQWDPVSEQFMFLGSPHANPSKFILYDAKKNQWRVGPQPSSCFNTGHTSGGCNVHSYYKTAIDTKNGKFYFGSSSRTLYEYDIPGNTWKSLTNFDSYYNGFAYFPELGGLFFTEGGGRDVRTYIGGSWSNLGQYPQGSIHSVALYNPVHKVVLFGGGNGSNALYTIDAQKNIKTIKSPPGDIRVCTSALTVDPVSGDYLLLYPDKGFHKYDVKTNVWTKLPDPVWVVPGAIGCGTGLVGAPISTYGINMFISYSPTSIFLYKHSAGQVQVESGGAESLRPAFSVHPNPFQARTRLFVSGRFLPQNPVFEVFAPSGKRVAVLKGTRFSEGFYADWNGAYAAKGIYLARLQAGRYTTTRKIYLK